MVSKINKRKSAWEMADLTKLWRSEKHALSEILDYIFKVIEDKAKKGDYAVNIYELNNEYIFRHIIDHDYIRGMIRNELMKLGYCCIIKNDYSKGWYYKIDWSVPTKYEVNEKSTVY